MIVTICQWLLVVMLVGTFFTCLRSDFYGRDAKAPGGFTGAVSTILVMMLLTLIYWQAGAFSQILP